VAIALKIQAPAGTSLRTLAKGFILTHQTDGKSPKTVTYYRDNLRRFLWFAEKQGWSDDATQLTEWEIREFLAYVGGEERRWGLSGNGSETSRPRASHSTVRHYFVVLSCFFNWAVREGFLHASPIARIKIAKPKARVIVPYSADEIRKLLAVCDHDFERGSRCLGSRNKAVLLLFLDTGLRLSELAGLRTADVENETGRLMVTGKGRKERVVRIGSAARKAIWRYLAFRPDNGHPELWLTEEGQPLAAQGIQASIKRLKARAGVNGSGSVHRFRHTFALSFLRADRNVFNLQYLLGHSDLKMVKRYTTTLGMEDALEAHVKASPADLLHLK
jgi:site-specific recombinase XerD